MHGLRIGPWRPDHRAALDEILEAPDELTRQTHDGQGADVAGPYWRRTVVAEDGGRPVGVATVFASRWHPERAWVGVEVALAHRRRGVGTALLQGAKDASRQAGSPLRGKVFAESPGARFAETRGFRVLQRSRTFRLGPSPRMTSEVGFLIDAAATPGAVAAAFLEFDVRSHTWDPPGDISVADVRASHLEDATATLLVGTDDGSVLAVGCLYDEMGGLLLSGGATGDDRCARSATGVLLDAAAAFAEARGRDLLVEADDSVPEVIEELLVRGGVVVEEVHIVAEQ